MKTSEAADAGSSSETKVPGESWARRIGRAVQALALALVVLVVVLRLLRIDQALIFRYGGF